MMNQHAERIIHRGRMFSFMFLLLMTFSLLPVISAPGARAQEESNQAFDKVIEIGVKAGQMKYDIEEFSVPAGGKIKLIFDNSNGTLQHNLLILVPGDEDFAIQLAQEAWSMQNPIQNDYVPDSDDVLFATSLLSPGEKETITFQAPEKPGDHPYVCTMPGHAMSMNGMMHVTGEGGKKEQTEEKKEEKQEQQGLYLTNLSYKYYEGTWDALPDFSKLEAKKRGTLSNNKLTLEPRDRKEKFAMVFEGTLHVPETGEYRIFQSSDDGSRLIIDGETALDHDGLHGATLALKTTKLTKGTHDYRVEYFQKPANLALSQAFVGPDDKRYVLSESNLDTTMEHLIMPTEEPVVVRALLPDVPTRSLAVGFPDGPHYVFDTVHGVVRYGWSGSFLNVGPLRGDGQGRGGGTVNVIGDRFGIGTTDEQPLRFGKPDRVPEVDFNGYELEGTAPPVLTFTLNGQPVRLTVTGLEEGRGFRFVYELSKTPEVPVFFRINREKVNVTSRSGSWVNDNTMKFEGKKKFAIMIHTG